MSGPFVTPMFATEEQIAQTGKRHSRPLARVLCQECIASEGLLVTLSVLLSVGFYGAEEFLQLLVKLWAASRG